MRRLLHHAAGLLLAAGSVLLFLLLLGGRLGQAWQAALSTPLWLFVAATVLSLGCLVLRTEVWRLCLRAAAPDKQPPRDAAYLAASTTFVAALLSHLFSPLVRIAILLRLAPQQTPRPTQMLTADAPAILAEVTTMTALVLVATAFLGFPLPLAAIFCAVTGLLAAALWVVRHRVHRPFVAGLALLGDRRLAAIVLACFAAVALLQLGRTAALLSAAGYPASTGESALAFTSSWATGILPVGATAGPSGTLAALPGKATEALAGGAMTLLATSLAADLLFAGYAGLVYGLHRLLDRRKSGSN